MVPVIPVPTLVAKGTVLGLRPAPRDPCCGLSTGLCYSISSQLQARLAVTGIPRYRVLDLEVSESFAGKTWEK